MCQPNPDPSCLKAAQFALQQCSRLINQYRGLDLGLADTAVMTTAETLGIYDILTVDERDFRAVKLTKPLTLLPLDAS